jgi:hypothetical protein
MADIARRESKFLEFSTDILEGRFRPDVEQYDSFAGFEGGRSDYLRTAQMKRVEDVNHDELSERVGQHFRHVLWMPIGQIRNLMTTTRARRDDRRVGAFGIDLSE